MFWIRYLPEVANQYKRKTTGRKIANSTELKSMPVCVPSFYCLMRQNKQLSPIHRIMPNCAADGQIYPFIFKMDCVECPDSVPEKRKLKVGANLRMKRILHIIPLCGGCIFQRTVRLFLMQRVLKTIPHTYAGFKRFLHDYLCFGPSVAFLVVSWRGLCKARWQQWCLLIYRYKTGKKCCPGRPLPWFRR